MTHEITVRIDFASDALKIIDESIDQMLALRKTVVESEHLRKEKAKRAGV